MVHHLKNRAQRHKIIFVLHNPIFFVTIMTGHQKAKVFVLNPLHGGHWVATKAYFWPKNLHFFTLHPYDPHFLGSDESDPMGS